MHDMMGSLYKRRETLIFCIADRRTINRSTNSHDSRYIYFARSSFAVNSFHLSYSFPTHSCRLQCFLFTVLPERIESSCSLWPWSCLEVTRWLSLSRFTIREQDCLRLHLNIDVSLKTKQYSSKKNLSCKKNNF